MGIASGEDSRKRQNEDSKNSRHLKEHREIVEQMRRKDNYGSLGRMRTLIAAFRTRLLAFGYRCSTGRFRDRTYTRFAKADFHGCIFGQNEILTARNKM